jgi:hypothetical protein
LSPSLRRYLAEGTMAQLYDTTSPAEPAEVMPAKIAS